MWISELLASRQGGGRKVQLARVGTGRLEPHFFTQKFSKLFFVAATSPAKGVVKTLGPFAFGPMSLVYTQKVEIKYKKPTLNDFKVGILVGSRPSSLGRGWLLLTPSRPLMEANPFWGKCDHGAFCQHRRRRQRRRGRIPCRRTAYSHFAEAPDWVYGLVLQPDPEQDLLPR
jgi:hypothetical protein